MVVEDILVAKKTRVLNEEGFKDRWIRVILFFSLLDLLCSKIKTFISKSCSLLRRGLNRVSLKSK